MAPQTPDFFIFFLIYEFGPFSKNSRSNPPSFPGFRVSYLCELRSGPFESSPPPKGKSCGRLCPLSIVSSIWLFRALADCATLLLSLQVSTDGRVAGASRLEPRAELSREGRLGPRAELAREG